jgi:hypothetical protein
LAPSFLRIRPIDTMPKTRVFQFRCCDPTRKQLVVAPMMATREAIELGGGAVIKHSAQDVDTVLVDPLGFYPTDVLRKPVAQSVAEHLSSMGLWPVIDCPCGGNETPA